MRDTIAAILAIIMLVAAIRFMLGGGRSKGHHHSDAGVIGWTCSMIGRALTRVVVLIVMFLVNTVTLLCRLAVHAGKKDMMVDDLGRWVERMTDAIVRPYGR